MQNNLVEEKYGHGAIIDKPDDRDWKFSDLAGSLTPFNWDQAYDSELVIERKLIVKNQYKSYSCGGQAWSYYMEAQDTIEVGPKSAKFIYAQTNVSPGGSEGRTNSELCRTKGVASETTCSSYLPDGSATEAFMTNKADLTPEAYADALKNREKSYLAVNVDIDTVAQAIENGKGVVLGVTGQNNGTWLTEFPVQPQGNTNLWNHWLYAGKAKLINGKKYIGVLNSWGTSAGDNGWQWLSEEYFKSGMIWACWTMVFNDQPSQYIFATTLRIGINGFATLQLQKELNSLGYALSEDAKFGKMTQLAVQNFQKKHGLVADGVVGPKTNAMLNTF